MLPAGFRSRVIARALSSGRATRPTCGRSSPTARPPSPRRRRLDPRRPTRSRWRRPGPAPRPSASARDGDDPVGAYRILGDTERELRRRPDAWGTWLSCEEADDGHGLGVRSGRPAARAGAPRAGRRSSTRRLPWTRSRGQLYLTEDDGHGRLLPLHPDALPGPDAPACWRWPPWRRAAQRDAGPGRRPDRDQPARRPARRSRPATLFPNGEGIWYCARRRVTSPPRPTRRCGPTTSART